MAKTYLVAGQAAPAADTSTELYVVPATKSFVASTLSVCNRDTAGVIAAYRVAIVPDGETLSNEHYIKYEALVESRDTKFLTLGLSLAAGDKVFVQASTGNLSFSLFGVIT